MMAGTPEVVLENHLTLEMDTTQALAGPPPTLSQRERKIKFILLNYSCFSFSQCASKLNHDTAAAAKSLQSCPTLCDPTDGNPLGSAIPGILQARTLEWVPISFSNA